MAQLPHRPSKQYSSSSLTAPHRVAADNKFSPTSHRVVRDSPVHASTNVTSMNDPSPLSPARPGDSARPGRCVVVGVVGGVDSRLLSRSLEFGHHD